MGNPQKRCIFCNRTGLSKEHFFSEWLRKLVPITSSHHTRDLIKTSPASRHIRGLKKRTERQGDIKTVKLRVVCERHCNNGWMSGLEMSAIPILTPLIKGQPIVLDASQQAIVAAWTAMKVMTAEHAEMNEAATPPAIRKEFMSNVAAPDYWNIWIAKHDSQFWTSGYMRHSCTFALAEPGAKPTPDRKSVAHNTQSVTIGIGALLIQVMACSVEGMEFDIPKKTRGYARQIWPASAEVTWPPDSILSEDDAYYIANAMHRFNSSSEVKWLPDA